MVKEFSDKWINDTYEDIHDEEKRRERLDDIRASLGFYTHDTGYIFMVADILNTCFDDLMGQGHYSKVIELYQEIISVFEGDIPIYDAREHFTTPTIGTNVQRFPTEYFTVKLNYTHAILMRHSLKEVRQHIYELRDLIPTVGYEYQLHGYYLLLKYNCFDHAEEIESGIVQKIENLLRSNRHLALDAYIAIAYYHYNKGDVKGMQENMQKITRILSRNHQFYAGEISKITAEQYLYLGIMYRDLREFDKALSYLNIALEQANRIDHTIHTMVILAEKALLYSFKQELEEAQYWIQLAVKKFNNLPERYGYQEAHIEHTRGLIAYYNTDFESALLSFERVLPIWQAYERDYHTALANNAIGSTLIQLERPKEAIDYLKHAKTICMPLDDKSYASDLLNIINTNLTDANNMLSN